MERAPLPRLSPDERAARAPQIGRRRRPPRRRLGWALLPALLLAAATSCTSGTPTDGWWAFNDLPAGWLIRPASPIDLPDSTRHGFRLRIHPNSTEAITVVEHPRQGTALQFPSTGQAALQLDDSARFNPGTRDFEVSVWISVTADQIGPDGANVIQKGLAHESQWKVQVDGGVPSCAYTDTEGRRVEWAGRPSTPVTDGAWYKVICRKTSTEVSLTVQRIGRIAPRPDVEPVTLGAISNDAPVTVGSKGTPTDYDQFRGRIDNVAVRVI
jgi:hypothetical protein